MRNAVVVRRFRGAFSPPRSRFCPGEPAESRRCRLQTAAGGAPGTSRLVEAHTPGRLAPPGPEESYTSFFLRARYGAKPKKTDIISCFWRVREEYYLTFTWRVEFLAYFIFLLARSCNRRRIILYTYNPREGGRRRQTRRYDNLLHPLLAPFCDFYADSSPTPLHLLPSATPMRGVSPAHVFMQCF